MLPHAHPRLPPALTLPPCHPALPSLATHQVVIRKNPQAQGGAQPSSPSAPQQLADTPATQTALPELREGDKVVFLGKTHFGCMSTILPEASADEAGAAAAATTLPGAGAVHLHLYGLAMGYRLWVRRCT